MDPPLPVYLFNVVSGLKDKSAKGYPIKKVHSSHSTDSSQFLTVHSSCLSFGKPYLHAVVGSGSWRVSRSLRGNLHRYHQCLMKVDLLPRTVTGRFHRLPSHRHKMYTLRS